LAGEAQVVGDGGGGDCGAAETLIGGGPDDGAVVAHDLLGDAQVVVEIGAEKRIKDRPSFSSSFSQIGRYQRRKFLAY